MVFVESLHTATFHSKKDESPVYIHQKTDFPLSAEKTSCGAIKHRNKSHTCQADLIMHAIPLHHELPVCGSHISKQVLPFCDHAPCARHFVLMSWDPFRNNAGGIIYSLHTISRKIWRNWDSESVGHLLKISGGSGGARIWTLVTLTLKPFLFLTASYYCLPCSPGPGAIHSAFLTCLPGSLRYTE